MKLIINLILALLVGFSGFTLYKSIQEPIAFGNSLKKRSDAVVQKLINVRDAQKMYWEVTGDYARDWKQLKDTLVYGQIKVEKVIGDPDDPNFTGEIIRDTIYIPVRDTVEALGWNLDSLKYVPYGEGATFDLVADTLTYKQVKVNVVQVKTRFENFMGKYADPRYAKYDDSYDPEELLKFGDLTKPTLAGSWDRTN